MPPRNNSSIADQIVKQQERTEQRRREPQPTESQATANDVVRAIRQQQSQSAVSPKDLLKQFIVREVQAQNLLGLPLPDIQAMSEVIATCTTKQEVFDWIQQTLMLPETVAAEVIKRRDDSGPFFDSGKPQQPLKTATTTPSASTQPSAAVGGGGPERRSAATVAGATVTVAPSESLPALPGSKPATQQSQGRSLAMNNNNNKPGSSKKSIADAKKGTTIPLTGPKQGPHKKPLVAGAVFQCDCFALDHTLIGNCLNCGRIICQQESLDVDCYHCGLDPKVCIAHEIKLQTGALDAAAQMKNKAGLMAALEKRDQLLKYAQEKAKRTTVVDDQSGVFGVQKSAWMSQAERDSIDSAEAAARRKAISDLHRQRGTYTVHLDIVNENVALGARIEDMDHTGKGAPVTSSVAAEGPEEGEEEDEADTDSAPQQQQQSTEEAHRIAPLPMLQKIWYNSEEGLSVGALATQLSQQKKKGGEHHQADSQEKAPVTRVLQVSSRLQNDYYQDDVQAWDTFQATASPSVGATSSSSHYDPFPASSLFDTNKWREILLKEDDAQSNGPAGLAGASTVSDAMREMVVQAHEERTAQPYTTIPKAMRHKDEGMCLSMHQPWASLLVAGIKTHEGRVWSTDFRGRLWIHAAGAKPTDVPSIEAHYRKFVKEGSTLRWPEHYPTSCLLGYVYVLDCLDHATYTANIPEEDRQEDSPFKLMCAGATALGFPLQMDGKHKIFKLERKLWLAAKGQLGEKV